MTTLTCTAATLDAADLPEYLLIFRTAPAQLTDAAGAIGDHDHYDLMAIHRVARTGAIQPVRVLAYLDTGEYEIVADDEVVEYLRLDATGDVVVHQAAAEGIDDLVDVVAP